MGPISNNELTCKHRRVAGEREVVLVPLYRPTLPSVQWRSPAEKNTGRGQNICTFQPAGEENMCLKRPCWMQLKSVYSVLLCSSNSTLISCRWGSHPKRGAWLTRCEKPRPLLKSKTTHLRLRSTGRNLMFSEGKSSMMLACRACPDLKPLQK